MKIHIQYCCTNSNCNFAPLREENNGLCCSNGHYFKYIENTKVPIFAFEADSNDYTIESAANVHDNSLRWVFETFNTDEKSLREVLISRLQLSKGKTVLITGVGTGNDLPFLMRSLEHDGLIFAQDISKQMLTEAIKRYGEKSNRSIDIYFSLSDAMNLPFANNVFDAAYHFGGINLFPDIQKGFSEMDRVVKPGGRVVISDEGAAPWLKKTELGKMLIKNNPLYAFDVPLSYLPDTAQSVNLSWVLSHCFYVIDYTVSDKLPNVNIDVAHLGKRGGTIRKRYSGQLEGIDPSLRDKIYIEAESLGISRVDYIEQLLSKGCK